MADPSAVRRADPARRPVHAAGEAGRLPPYDAVVLAGGTAQRFGGVDKLTQPVGGRPLLDRVLSAVTDAERRIVVGPRRQLPAAQAVGDQPDVDWVGDRWPGGGPVAGITAGLSRVGADWVAVLAGDLPFLTRTVLGQVRAAAVGADGAVPVDADGREQHLLGVWRTDRLQAALRAVGDPTGLSVRRLLRPLSYRRVEVRLPPGCPPPWFDCDTAADLADAEEWMCPR